MMVTTCIISENHRLLSYRSTSHMLPHEETLIDITLHKDELQHYRTRFPVSLDWDAFALLDE